MARDDRPSTPSVAGADSGLADTALLEGSSSDPSHREGDAWSSLDDGELRTLGERYVVGAMIARGGVGAVFRAFDPELDREVAIKILRPDSSHEAALLLEEARTIATLSHPNVVEVYDAGMHRAASGREHPFVVMELVRGRDLARALREETWPTRRIVSVFLEAARGLAAAHERGIVHRDFKPGNVLLGSDGSVKVADFGTGFVRGTLKYMSPEQATDEPLDGRSDQYSFCVALYEALEGTIPRKGLFGPLRPPNSIPRRLWQVLQRGLENKARNRFDSMTSLIAEAERSRRPRWPYVLIPAAVIGLFVVDDSKPTCPDPSEVARQFFPDADRRAVRIALTEATRARGSELWDRTAKPLDTYVRQWTQLRIEACENGRSGLADPDTVDGILVCLERRRRAFTALVRVLREADVTTANRAPIAARSLAAVNACADPEADRSELSLPADPKLRRRVEELEERLAEVRALELAGHYDEGLVLARRAVDEAESLGHGPTTAQARYRLGVLLSIAGNDEEAGPVLKRAAYSALEHGQDVITFGAAVKLMAYYGTKGNRERSEEWRRHAEAAVSRGGLPEDVEARLELELGVIDHAAGNAESALAHSMRAVDLFSTSLGEDHLETANALNNAGAALFLTDQTKQASQYMERAAQIRRSVLGPTHPKMATSLVNLSAAAIKQDRLDVAQRHLESAEPAIKHLPKQHVARAIWYQLRGALAFERDREDEALDLLETALELGLASDDRRSAHAIYTSRQVLCLVHMRARRFDQAKAVLDEALSVCRGSECGKLYLLRSVYWHALDQPDEADTDLREALERGQQRADFDQALVDIDLAP